MADYLPPVVAKLTGDDSDLTRTLTRSIVAIRKFAVDAGKIKATVNVEAKLKDGTLAEIRRRVNESPAAKLKVELQLGAAQREELRRGLEERPVQVAVRPVMDQAALRRVRIILAELGRRIDVPIRPQVDDSSARRTLVRLNRLSADRTVTIRTRVIGDTNRLGGGGDAGGAGALAALISLAPALVPVAASAASVAASVGAATVAVGAFGVAVIPQIKDLGDAADAQKKYNEAVSKYGPQSKQAVAAQTEFAKTMAAMPPATRQAAGGLMVLKDRFKSWSDGLAKFTMAPVTKSFAVMGALLPKLTPLVRGTSGEFDRLVTVLAGGVNSSAFDGLMSRFTTFTNGVLQRGVDGIIHFARVLSEGQANGPIAQFMAYSKANGPAVSQTLGNISKAVARILEGASQAGPGMLTLVNAMAKLVASLPPSFIARAMELYTAFKLIKLVGSGFGPVSGGVSTLVTRITALRAASVAAGGGMAGLRAAFVSMNAATKGAVVLTVIAGLALAAYKLESSTKEARISIDELSRSIENGMVKGRITSPVIDDLRKAQQGLVKDTDATASAWDKFGYSFTHWGAKFSSSATSAKAMANDYRDLGNALGKIAQDKGVDTATQALKLLNKEGVKVPTKYLKDYNNALADAAFESKLTAQAQGLFGDQAQAVQKKLAAQKQSADGLRQSIQALSDVNQSAYDSETKFEAAISDASSAIKANGRTLDIHSEKGRANRDAISAMASTAKDLAAQKREETGSWEASLKVYDRAHTKMVRAYMDAGDNRDQAEKLTKALLGFPSPTLRIRMQAEDAKKGLRDVLAAINRTPDSKSVTVKALTADAIRALDAAGFKVAHMKDGRFKVTADTGSASSHLTSLRGQLNAIDGRHAVASITIATYYTGGKRPGEGTVLAPNAYGGVVRKFAGGGTVPGYAPLRDTVPAILSPGEGVLVPEAVRRMGGEAAVNAINRQARGSGGAAGIPALGGNVIAALRQGAAGAPGLGRWVGQGLTEGLLGSVPAVAAASVGVGRALVAAFRDELEISSPSKKFKTLAAWVAHGLIDGLTGSTAKVRAATQRLARSLYVDFGSHHERLQRYEARESRALMSLAVKRDAVAKRLKDAQKHLADLKKAWADEAKSVAAGIMQGFSVVTEAPQEGFALTTQDVINKMRDQMAKAVQFAAQLQALKKKGLRADLIEQIAAAGVDQGGATATALTGASKGQIAELNRLQKTTKAAAGKAGSAVADAMYGAGIKSAQGLVKGLKSQEHAIEKMMMRIARGMQKALRKALGIKSPSQVFADLGVYIPQGLAQGIEAGAHHATRAVSSLAGAVAGAATMGGSGLALAGGGVTVVHNHYEPHITVEGSVMTERQLVDVVQRGFLRMGARNSQTWAPYKR